MSPRRDGFPIPFRVGYHRTEDDPQLMRVACRDLDLILATMAREAVERVLRCLYPDDQRLPARQGPAGRRGSEHGSHSDQ